MLEYFITSRTKRSLLKLLLTNPDKRFYVREIARLTGEPVNAVRRELGYLEKAGLVRAYARGNLKYYDVVREFPFFLELKKIIYATVGLGDYLRERFESTGSIDFAFVYGSVARNEETARSDIDLFVVGEITEADLHNLVRRAEHETGREINYTLMTRSEFADRKSKGEPFIKRVLKEPKVFLIGSLEFVAHIDSKLHPSTAGDK
ncbi:MAG: nucleotidyltransferase domain-containing protein [Chloroflexi bacterium]|nr:nucleotidyltransferase domain-containing protein [Chloroflexota bacterium]